MRHPISSSGFFGGEVEATPSAAQATPGEVQDPSWTLGQWSGASACSELENDFEKKVEVLNETMKELSQGNFQPLTAPLTKKWEDATPIEKSDCLKTAEMSCRIVCGVIAPNSKEKLYEALTMANKVQMSNDLVALSTAYKNAPTKSLKTQILSLYALNYSFEELKKLHEPFEKLSDRQIKKARMQARKNGPGVPLQKTVTHRVRIDMIKLDHFLTFVNRPYFYQDVAYGQRTLKLDNGERLTMPNIIRTVTRSTMISQYQSFCEEDGFEPLSRATMFRVLKVREASQRKSLQGLDNTSADGAEGFHRITRIVDDLEEQYGVCKEWCSEARNGLKKAKCYLKTEYRVHCRKEESACADHCRKFALSDPVDEDFQQQCLHNHNVKCGSCEELKTVLESVEKKLNESSSSMYNKEQHDDLLYDFNKSVNSITEWKCHILRSENQEIAKQSLIQNLSEDSVFIVADWAMKFLQRQFREKQCDWYAKRGMSWHVSCVLASDGHGKLLISYYNHLLNSCSQDWFAVLSILENLFIAVTSSNPRVKKAYLRSDEAGCYHNSQLIAAMRDIGERVGVSVERYDFSEPQSGKDVCDRILCPMKGAIRRYCNEGHDILSAMDMHNALQERSVLGCTAAVCRVNETNKDLDVKKLHQFSTMHDFRYEIGGLRVWKAFQVGPGKLIPWNDIYVSHQSATELIIEGNFVFVPKAIRESSRDRGEIESSGDTESSDEVSVFECSDPGCRRTFKSVEDMELHMSVGQHTETVFNKVARDFVEKFSSLTLTDGEGTVSTEEVARELSSSNLSQGWALHKLKGGGGRRFSDKVRQYLTSKFDIGVISGRKEDPGQVSQDMRKAKSENGDRLFSRDEWLTKSQVQGFFSRLSSSRKKKTDPALSTDEDDTFEDSIDEEDISHMTTVEAVVKEIGLCHPIVYDIHNLCDYAQKGKFTSFTVSMLKDICLFFDLPFKSRDTKAVLISKVKQMISECSCSTGS